MRCSRCGTAAEKAGVLAWYAVPWLLLLGVLPSVRSMCVDCASGRNFLALLATVAALAVAFVVAVILL
jgi:hypothetical protein